MLLKPIINQCLHSRCCVPAAPFPLLYIKQKALTNP